MVCILQDYRSDRCAGCSGMCQHRIVVEGLTGKGGLVEKASIPINYRGVTLDTSKVRADKPELYGFIDKYLEQVKRFIGGGSLPRSLYFYSSQPGTGKTTTAVALLNGIISLYYLYNAREGIHSNGEEAFFLDVNELQTLYNTFNRPRVPDHIAEPASFEYYTRLEKAKRATIAVFDDIGVRSSTEGFMGDLHTVINHRVVNSMPTIYTSNLEMEEMVDVFTPRLYDRIRDNAIPVFFEGKSHRGL